MGKGKVRETVRFLAPGPVQSCGLVFQKKEKDEREKRNGEKEKKRIKGLLGYAVAWLFRKGKG